MKKTLLLPALAMIMMASCTQDEYAPSKGSEGNAITFSLPNKAIDTRSGVTKTSLNSFTVTAQNSDMSLFFDKVQFSFNTSKNVYESSSPFYWPTDGSLSFYAISDPSTTITTDASTGAPQYTYCDWSGETDLVSATVKSGVKTIPYPLTFRHLTSQIHVSVKADNQTEVLTYKLLGIRMTTPCEGTYSFASTTGETGTWVIDNEKTKQYSYADGIGSGKSFSQKGSVTLPNTYWNILPNKDGEILFEVEYEIYQEGKRIGNYTGATRKVCKIDAPNLEAGKIYTYNFLLSNTNSNVISFTTDLKSWVDGGSEDMDVTEADNSITCSAKAVDMGLSVKWADRNVGAESSTDRGKYFAWGQTVGYTPDEVNQHNSQHDYIFSSSVYSETYAASINHDLSVDDNTDAARINMGGKWRMPTRDEFIELYNPDNCTKEIKQYDGVSGYEFTSLKTGNKIFLPYTGACNPGIFSTTTGGFYWTSTNHNYSTAIMFAIASSECEVLGYDRYIGEAIRAVRE